MPSYFRTSRNVELSTLKYLEDSFTIDWSGITLVKTFKEVYAKNIKIPVVCVRLADTGTVRLEIGSKTLENRYLIIIDVFARSDAQRLDIADYIMDKLKEGWVHYEHGHVSGDNTTLELTANGRDNITEFVTDARIDFTETVDEKDKYRHNISVRVRTS